MVMTLPDEILHRLYGVREDGYNQWRACCPACCWRRRTLLVRIDSACVTWLHCDNECPPSAILRGVGLSWSALYPPGHRRSKHAPPCEWWKFVPRYTRDLGPMGER